MEGLLIKKQNVRNTYPCFFSQTAPMVSGGWSASHLVVPVKMGAPATGKLASVIVDQASLERSAKTVSLFRNASKKEADEESNIVI